MDEELSIRIKAHLDSGVKRALAGITSDIKKSEREKQKAAVDSDKAIVDSAKKTRTARVREVTQFVSAVRRAVQTA